MRILMPPKVLLVIAGLALGVACWLGIRRYREVRLCQQRAIAFQTKADSVRRTAIQTLRIGTSQDNIVRFFEQNHIPFNFDRIGNKSEASGTLSVPGLKECGSIACGSDAALIGVEVDVDDAGNVASQPLVITMGTDCL